MSMSVTYQFEKWAVHRNSDLSVSDYGVAIGRFVVTLSRCLACGFRAPLLSSPIPCFLRVGNGYLVSPTSRATLSTS
jgi:hypothetical protein